MNYNTLKINTMDDSHLMLTIDCRYELQEPQPKYLIAQPEHYKLVASFFKSQLPRDRMTGIIFFRQFSDGGICVVFDNLKDKERLFKIVTLEQAISFAVELRANDQCFRII